MATDHNAPSGPHRAWERQWQAVKGDDFDWSLDDVAPQLRERVDAGGLIEGRALDLGCGAGRATVFLSEHFSPAVGIDIAFSAVTQASTRAGVRPARFVVADAARLPFGDASFAFIFDRGCLQNLDEPQWSHYFNEVERLLVAGGSLQVLVSKAVPEFPALMSSRGLRQRWNWYGRGQRSGPQFLSHGYLERLRPPSMSLDLIEDFPFRTKVGKARLFTHAVFTKGR